VRPILDCVVENHDGTLTALWGYENESSKVVTIPVGSDNKFSPSPKDRGQPKLFAPGRTPYAVGAFSCFSSGTLSWKPRPDRHRVLLGEELLSTGPRGELPRVALRDDRAARRPRPGEIDLLSVRLVGTVEADDRWSRVTDVDGDGPRSCGALRFARWPFLAPGPTLLVVSGVPRARSSRRLR
jgi:hypothetical protein